MQSTMNQMTSHVDATMAAMVLQAQTTSTHMASADTHAATLEAVQHLHASWTIQQQAHQGSVTATLETLGAQVAQQGAVSSSLTSLVQSFQAKMGELTTFLQAYEAEQAQAVAARHAELQQRMQEQWKTDLSRTSQFMKDDITQAHTQALARVDSVEQKLTSTIAQHVMHWEAQHHNQVQAMNAAKSDMLTVQQTLQEQHAALADALADTVATMKMTPIAAPMVAAPAVSVPTAEDILSMVQQQMGPILSQQELVVNQELAQIKKDVMAAIEPQIKASRESATVTKQMAEHAAALDARLAMVADTTVPALVSRVDSVALEATTTRGMLANLVNSLRELESQVATTNADLATNSQAATALVHALETRVGSMEQSNLATQQASVTAMAEMSARVSRTQGATIALSDRLAAVDVAMEASAAHQMTLTRTTEGLQQTISDNHTMVTAQMAHLQTQHNEVCKQQLDYGHRLQDLEQRTAIIQERQQERVQPEPPATSAASSTEVLTAVANVAAGLAEQRVALINTQAKMQASLVPAVAAAETRLAASLEASVRALVTPALSTMDTKLASLDAHIAAVVAAAVTAALPSPQPAAALAVDPRAVAAMVVADVLPTLRAELEHTYRRDAEGVAMSQAIQRQEDREDLADAVAVTLQEWTSGMDVKLRSGLEQATAVKFQQIDATLDSLKALEINMNGHHATMTSLEAKLNNQLNLAATTPVTATVGAEEQHIILRTKDMQAWLREQTAVEQRRKEVFLRCICFFICSKIPPHIDGTTLFFMSMPDGFSVGGSRGHVGEAIAASRVELGPVARGRASVRHST